jgi:hypothetical protein
MSFVSSSSSIRARIVGFGDLVSVQVQDRQHRAVAYRVEELAGVPGGGQRPGLRLAVADHARRDEVRVVERGAVRVRQAVAQLPTLVNGPGGLRRDVAGHPAGEGELAEQPGHAGLVVADVRVHLRQGALQPDVRDQPRPAVARPGDVEHVAAAGGDDPVEVGVDEVQPGRGAPVPEQPALDLVGSQRLPQQRVLQQVDLTHRQVVRRAPVRVQAGELPVAQRLSGHDLHGFSLPTGAVTIPPAQSGIGMAPVAYHPEMCVEL